MSINKLLVIAFLLFSSRPYAQDTINWSKKYKLKWTDFKSKPPLKSDFGAISSVTITYKLKYDESSFTCKVFCFFSKDDSWTKASDSIGLAHEQGHFNISALFAARLRKAIKSYYYHPATIKSDLQTIYKGIIKERDEYNKTYDRETNFSRNKKKQAYWSSKIDLELKKLAPFNELM